MKKLIVSIACFAIVGCGGGASRGSNSGFNITSITPSNNSTIPVSQAFIANFSNNVDSATIGNVSLATESGTNVLLSCASASVTSIICTPTTQLNYATKYALTYGSGIKNVAGNSLNQKIYNYITFSNQGVASILPAAGAISPNNTTWNIVFGESMQLATLNTSQTPGNVTLTQTTTSSPINVPITCTSTDPASMSCVTSQSQLALNESYVLTVTNKIISQNSIPITPQIVNYTTSNYITPTVAVNPTAGAIALTQTTFTAKFNINMDMSNFTGNVTFRDTTSGSNLTIACTSSDNINVHCALQGVSQLTYNHNYTLTFGLGIKSLQGIAITSTNYQYNTLFSWRTIESSINFTFKDGIPNTYGPLKDESGKTLEVFNFTDVSVSQLDKENCFELKNRTPRNFRKLSIKLGDSGTINPEYIKSFTTYKYCLANNESKIASTLKLESLPNPYFNIVINGFWSDTNPKYSYFTKLEKEQLTRALVEMRYMLNREEFRKDLSTRINNKEDADEIVNKFRSTTKSLHPLMLNCCVEGQAVISGDWFAIHKWRYNDDAANLMSIALHDTLEHEIGHSLGYPDGSGVGKDTYAIGSSASAVMAQYYNDKTIQKDLPIWE